MKLKGELKEKVEKAENKEQAKEILDNTGIELTDEELEQVSGGIMQLRCYKCRKTLPAGTKPFVTSGLRVLLCEECIRNYDPHDYCLVP